jgi:hypothetical protein
VSLQVLGCVSTSAGLHSQMFFDEMTMAFPALGEGFKFWETWTGSRSGVLGVSRGFYQNSSGYAFSLMRIVMTGSNSW